MFQLNPIFMSEQRRRIAGLIIKRRYGVVSHEEDCELEGWAELRPENAALLQECLEDAWLSEHTLYDPGPEDWREGWEQLMAAPSVQAAFRDRRYRCARIRRRRSIALVAAVWLFLLGGAAVLFFSGRRGRAPTVAASCTVDMYQAKLVTATGQTSQLNGRVAAGSVIAQDEGIEISIPEAGHLCFGTGKELFGGGDLTEHAGKERTPSNAVSTPPGALYRVTLSDGSKVYLNGGSTIRFPTRFGHQRRCVRLEGEALFEVAPRYTDQHERVPFVVHTLQQGVETDFVVTGTTFNVSSYADDHSCKAVLLTGVISVKEGNDGLRSMQAGESYVRDSNGQPGVLTTADTTGALAWTNGLWRFKDRPVIEVMRQIARWYNMKLLYQEGTWGNMTLSGCRTEPVADLLRRVKASQPIRLLTTGNTIVVSMP